MKSIVKGVTVFALIAVFIAASFIIPFGGTAIASAADNLTYGSFGPLSNNWYYKEDALDLARAKQEVSEWDLSGLDGTAPIVIAVVDTGINSGHEIFKDVLLTNSEGKVVGHNSTEALQGGSGDKVNIGDVSSSHGTKVAGVIASLIKEFGLENYIKIYPIKANTETADGKDAFMLSNMLEAIAWSRNIALDQKTIAADVINLSFGNSPKDKNGMSTDIVNWRDSVKLQHELTTTAENAVIVASAGNYGKDSASGADYLFYPAVMQGVLSVMAYGESGLCADYNYGTAYDIAAPGKGVVTSSTTVGSASQYVKEDGTSMAAPFVSFAAALLRLRYKLAGADSLKGYRLTHYLRNVADIGSYKDYTFRKLDLHTIVSQDFENTVSQVRPTGIEVTHDGKTGSVYAAEHSGNRYESQAKSHADEIFMVADDVSAVNFHAKLLPYGETISEYDEMVEWVLVNAKGEESVIGHGTNLSYTPTAFGATKIICRLSGEDIQLEQVVTPVYICYKDYIYGSVCVTYLENADDSARTAPTSGVLYTTKKTVFTLTDLKYLDPDVPVKWYVNGEYAGEGATFTFRPSRVGSYIIGAQYGDNNSVLTMKGVAFYADVHSFMELPLDMSMVILACVLAVGAATALIVVAVRRKRAVDTAAHTTVDSAKPKKEKKPKKDKNITIAKR